MKSFKRYITLLLATLFISVNGQAASFTDETLRYNIIYHWGLIWKQAGTAQLRLRVKSDRCYSQLACRTDPWADKIFMVRDTLLSTFTKADLKPLIYKKNAHEGDDVVHDVVRYGYTNGTVKADCSHHRSGRDPYKTSFTATGAAFDMLSIFYYLRTLDYANMGVGKEQTVVVFSGRRKEYLKIRYVGVDEVELYNGSKTKAHHIKFSFTQDGNKKSSDDLDTWISLDAKKVPLMLKGKLPIGEVRCYLTKR